MIRSTEEFRAVVKAARRVGTPLIAVQTADPTSSIAQVSAGVNGKNGETPLVVWDFIGGLQGRNDAGKSAVAKVLGENSPALGPGDVLALAARFAADAVFFVLNPQRVWEQPDVVQGMWNLRDVFKAGGQMLVLVTPPGATLPVELQNDVMVFDEPLPSPEDLALLVADTFESAGLPAADEATLSKAIDALVGLAAFPAEQVLAMSLSKNGLDLGRLWERKRQAVEQTPGLTIWRGGETFDQIGGCDCIKRFLAAVLEGREAPRVIVFVDEIEKAFAGTGTDMSGVKTEMTGTMLSWMQDRGADGIVFIGPPGAAKSAVGKAAGATAGIPTVAFDLSAMQNSLVGGSGERLRAALQVVDAISQGRSLWIATCNSITSLPPELRRRFTLGTFFFDLPSAEERKAIWEIYLKKWNLRGELIDDEGWTGAEIKECCRKAWRLKLSLRESAEYIVPVSRSAADQIEALRRQASGRFLSAAQPGVFTAESHQVPVGAGKRTFRDAD
ncbi:MAG: hypothetical protein KIT09_16100 [Bryobacteraceae bacterium]|nr:hypothetical protein [Bryobacteraceae bacterium]